MVLPSNCNRLCKIFQNKIFGGGLGNFRELDVVLALAWDGFRVEIEVVWFDLIWYGFRVRVQTVLEKFQKYRVKVGAAAVG